MADNYQQWSAAIEELTEEEMAWIEKVFENSPEEEEEEEEEEEDVLCVSETGVGHVEFTHIVDRSAHTFYAYAEEYADLSPLIRLVSAFIKKFRPDYVFKLSWADTCSKPRAGEFTGGGVVVSREGDTWFILDEILDEEVERILAVRGSDYAPDEGPSGDEEGPEDVWQVHSPGDWDNELSNHPLLKDWYAVSNDAGIVAYFGDEEVANRYRDAEIARWKDAR